MPAKLVTLTNLNILSVISPNCTFEPATGRFVNLLTATFEPFWKKSANPSLAFLFISALACSYPEPLFKKLGFASV